MNNMPPKSTRPPGCPPYWFAVVAAISLVAGCGKPPAGPKAAGSGGPPAGGGGGFAIQAVVAEARPQPIHETLALVATIAPNEMVEIKSETDGRLDQILFEEGQRINKGDLLLKLDESKAAAAVAEAEANLKLSRITHERNQQLLRARLVSQQEFDQTEAQFQAFQASLDLKKRLWQDTRIHAPFSGVAGSRVVSPGQVIARNTTLTWLVDLDTVKVEIPVPERFLGQVKPGQTIDLTAAAFPGRRFRGEVWFVSPVVDPATRTVLVKARIPNPDRALKPGMLANLELSLRVKENALLIPESSIVASGDRTLVYTVGADDVTSMRPVKLGLRLPGMVEVISGLAPNERVVAEGTQKVRPGGRVKPVPYPHPSTNGNPASPAPSPGGTNRPAAVR